MNKEAKLGIIAIITSCCLILLVWLVGYWDIFNKSKTFYVGYDYAAGLNVGSPVRVSGIQVGKVKKIEFFSPVPKSPEKGYLDFLSEKKKYIPIKVTISVDNGAAVGLSRKTLAHINMAGVIGERLIELVPQNDDAEILQEGDWIQGINPPRFDQLISGSFNLAEKILSMLDENKEDVKDIITNIRDLTANVSAITTKADMKNFQDIVREFSKHKTIVQNLEQLSGDLAFVTKDFRSEKGEETFALIHELIWRLKGLDSKAIQKFLQDEGVKVRFFGKEPQ